MLMHCPELFQGGTVVNEVVANIDIAPTVMQAMGLQKPAHMDGDSFIALSEGKEVPWRKYFLYAYYWEQNYPQTPTHFSLRGNRYKYTTYYGIWDTDELFDIQADPQEQHNLIHDPKLAKRKTEMQDRLYAHDGRAGRHEYSVESAARQATEQNGYARKALTVEAVKTAADFPEADDRR